MTKGMKFKILKGTDHVFLKIDDREYQLTPFVARQVGETLFKVGVDLGQMVEARDGDKK